MRGSTQDVAATGESKPEAAPKAHPPLWGELARGPHGVGFTTCWELDFARRYDPQAAGAEVNGRKRWRPILVLAWYPAKEDPAARPMRHREYLEIGAPRPGCEEFARRLVEFNMDVICDEVMNKGRADLAPAVREALEQFLETPAAAVRNATPAGGRFPLVLNHPGLGGAIEDNTVLFEFLASHGYVVINSAFQSESTSVLNIDWDLERSIKDLDYLINWACRRTDVDPDHLAVMGHSYGGQAALGYRTETNSPVDAVVSLDATIEYATPEHLMRRPRFVERMSRIDAMTVPMLIFTQKRASPRFDVYEGMKFAERHLAQVEHLRHNDFISHGAIGADIRRRRNPADSEAAAIRQCYELICRQVLSFFDAYLKHDGEALQALRSVAEGNGIDASLLSIARREAAPMPPSAT